MGLAYLAAGSERRDEVPAMLDEADALARQSVAAGITHQINEARQQLIRSSLGSSPFSLRDPRAVTENAGIRVR